MSKIEGGQVLTWQLREAMIQLPVGGNMVQDFCSLCASCEFSCNEYTDCTLLVGR